MSSNNEMSPEEEAKQIRDSFADEYQDCDLDEIVQSVKDLRGMKGVDKGERKRAVISGVSKSLGVDRDELLGVDGENGGGNSDGADVVKVGEAKELGDEQWVSLQGVTAMDVGEHGSDAIGQQGRLGDDTGTIRFIAWAKSEIDELEEGKTYNLDPVVTDEYQGTISLNINSVTEIEESDEEVEVNEEADMETHEGVFVAINEEKSGLIRRDAETGEPVSSQDAAEEVKDDLRLLGTLDNGKTTQNIAIQRELTEEITGINMEEATEMALDALDRDVVIDAMMERVLGRYYRISGIDGGRYFFVNEIEQLGEAEADDDLLIRARSIQ